MTDERQLWHQRDDENKNQAQAFSDYAMMGTGRSIAKLCEVYRGQADGESLARPPTTRKPTLETWSAKFDWVERAAAYDGYQITQAQIAHEQMLRNMQDAWKQREREALEELATILAEAREYTKGVEVRTTTKDGREVIIAKSSASDLRALVDTHNKLAQFTRLVYDMPTDITESRNRDLTVEGMLAEANKIRQRQQEQDSDGDDSDY